MTEHVQPTPIDTLRSAELPDSLPKVGLIGMTRAGKGTAVELLREIQGFESHTISDGIREYPNTNNIPLLDRHDYWSTRIKMEEEFGTQIHIDLALKVLGRKYQEKPNMNGAIIDGIRTSAVTDHFKTIPNSFLLGIDSSVIIRYKRLSLGGITARQSFDEFLAFDKIERESVEPELKKTDMVILNDGSIKEYKAKVLEAVHTRFNR